MKQSLQEGRLQNKNKSAGRNDHKIERSKT